MKRWEEVIEPPYYQTLGSVGSAKVAGFDLK
jgi:hypothetical protein